MSHYEEQRSPKEASTARLQGSVGTWTWSEHLGRDVHCRWYLLLGRLFAAGRAVFRIHSELLGVTWAGSL